MNNSFFLPSPLTIETLGSTSNLFNQRKMILDLQTTEPLSLFLLGELNVNNKMKTAFVRIYIFINNELKIIP